MCLVPYDGMNHDEIIVKLKKCEKVYDKVVEFMIDNKVTCEESIYQCDYVIEHAYSFMTNLFRLVESDLNLEYDED